MSQLGDTIVQFPLSGTQAGVAGNNASIPLAAFLRTVQQASSASNYVVYHPGGVMTGSLLLAGRNNNRMGFTLFNSGTLLLLLDHGAYFNPGISPPPGVSTADRGVLAGSQYDENSPVYTGQIHIGWAGSGTLSGSCAVFTEYLF
jgi:hypothetical protein